MLNSASLPQTGKTAGLICALPLCLCLIYHICAQQSDMHKHSCMPINTGRTFQWWLKSRSPELLGGLAPPRLHLRDSIPRDPTPKPLSPRHRRRKPRRCPYPRESSRNSVQKVCAHPMDGSIFVCVCVCAPVQCLRAHMCLCVHTHVQVHVFVFLWVPVCLHHMCGCVPVCPPGCLHVLVCLPVCMHLVYARKVYFSQEESL